jgi:phosphoenolpyruvate synthase/pyruvate phosphate dikinase
VPPGVAQAIGDAYGQLGRRLAQPNPVVAIRASVVDDEPTFGPTAPALTGVVGFGAVVEGVRTCWQALFNGQAMITRAAKRHAVEPAMAVIVQELVPLARSGTAYTTDPVRRRDDVVRITAAFGDDASTERLRPLADSYLVARRSHELVELCVADKVTGAGRYRRVLSDDDASLVTTAALDVERCVGRPVAVGWSLSADATVIVLQAEVLSGALAGLELAG